IINSLKNLGKSYHNQELVRKILRCLPKSWTPKVTAIEEAKDPTTLPLEQLHGSLMTHETTMMNHESEEIKKKIVALKVSKENEDVSDEDGAMALITTHFKTFLKSQKGHYKNECPKLKKKEQFKKNKEQSKKKKAMIVTWSDSDYSSSDEESDGEEANINFMAIENEEEDEVQFSFDELETAYEKLFYEFESVSLNNRILKKYVISLSREIETLKNENSNYKNEIQILDVSLRLSNDFKEENEKLKTEVDSL
ncbi:LOW QUALITY PROTEIN: UBN2 domain-containing protein, partial [Cephalotus follicularis]